MKIRLRFTGKHTLVFTHPENVDALYEMDFRSEEAEFEFVSIRRNKPDDATVILVKDDEGLQSSIFLYDTTEARYNPVILSLRPE